MEVFFPAKKGAGSCFKSVRAELQRQRRRQRQTHDSSTTSCGGDVDAGWGGVEISWYVRNSAPLSKKEGIVSLVVLLVVDVDAMRTSGETVCNTS